MISDCSGQVRKPEKIRRGFVRFSQRIILMAVVLAVAAERAYAHDSSVADAFADAVNVEAALKKVDFAAILESAGNAGAIFAEVAVAGTGEDIKEPDDGFLRRARVWQPQDIESLDLSRGPAGLGGLESGGVVECDYDREVTLRARDSGNTRKFFCRSPAYGLIRVRYLSRELHAGAAATRLFWALGFGADRVYPATVQCLRCPEDPWTEHVPAFGGGGGRPPRIARSFAPAAIDFRHPAPPLLETAGRQWSWGWDRLDEVDPAMPELRIHRQALKFLAAFVQHGDNKLSQQRAVCLETATDRGGRRRCAKPFLYVADLGATFGGAGKYTNEQNSKMSFVDWAGKCVWRRSGQALLEGAINGTMTDPVISEDGRRFLAALLQRLSQAQVRHIFGAAQVEALQRRGEAASTQDWVDAFNLKVREVQENRCLTVERRQLLEKAVGISSR